MLILPAFIHAQYYIRNSISVEPQNRTCLTIVSFFDAAAAAEYNLAWTSESHEEITDYGVLAISPRTLKWCSLQILQSSSQKGKKKRSETAHMNALHGCKSCTARYYSALTSEMRTLSTRGHLLQLRNLVMAQGHLIMAPIFKLAHQHQSGSYLEELHDLRLCHPPWIKPFITRWHFCPVLNACTPWESDEASGTWRVMDNPLLCKGWQSVCCGGQGVGGGDLAVTSRPCQPLRLADASVSALPPVPDPHPNPPHLRWRTAWRREITHSRWGHLRWLAHPSIVSLSHVTYSCFVVETL